MEHFNTGWTNESSGYTPEISVSVPSLQEEQHILRKYLPDQKWDLAELEKDREGQKLLLLKFGSKSVLLYFLDNNEFVTVVANTGGEKIAGDTTTVYRRAKELMQSKADALNKKLLYENSTTDEKIVRWAKGPGQQIFRWSKIEEPTKTDKQWHFTTNIIPQPKTGLK